MRIRSRRIAALAGVLVVCFAHSAASAALLLYVSRPLDTPGIIRITQAGSVTPFYTSGFVGDIAFDGNNYLYVANSNNGGVFKIAPGSIGGPGGGPGGAVTTVTNSISEPSGLAFDKNWNLFVSDWSVREIKKITPGGTVSTFVSGLAGTPVGLCFDNNGNLYTALSSQGIVAKITPAGSVSTFAYTGNPIGVAFEPVGQTIYVSDYGGSVFRFGMSGTGGVFASNLGTPFGITLDEDRNVYSVDYNGGRIFKISPAGVTSVFRADLRAPQFARWLPIPEPSSLALLAVVTIPMMSRRRRHR